MPSRTRLLSAITRSLSLLCILAVVSDGCSNSRRPKKPHVIFIVADDLGYHDVGYRGAPFKTDNIDALAAEGVKLENYYAGHMCSPSRSMLMTGKYTIRSGIHKPIPPGAPSGVPPQMITIADIFKSGGYSTGFFGKWHLGFYKKIFYPQHRGFDRFYGMIAGVADHYTYETCDYFHYLPDPTNCGFSLLDGYEPARSDNGTYSTDLFVDKSIEMIRDAGRQEKPLFMFLSFQALHTPYEVPEEFLAPFMSIEDEERRTIAGMAYAMDQGVGRVVEALKQNGMWENTIIAFSSDNGGTQAGNNYPLRGLKATLWEGGVKVPGFISGLRVSRHSSGTTLNELMDMTDWLPTLADAAEIDVCPELHLDGISQWPAIQGDFDSGYQPKTETLHELDLELLVDLELPLYNDTFDSRAFAAIRMGDYKLITGHTSEKGSVIPPPEWNMVAEEWMAPPNTDPDHHVWLFNVKEDPSETIDLSDVQREKVKEMLNRLKELSELTVDPGSIDSDLEAAPRYHDGVWRYWK